MVTDRAVDGTFVGPNNLKLPNNFLKSQTPNKMPECGTMKPGRTAAHVISPPITGAVTSTCVLLFSRLVYWLRTIMLFTQLLCLQGPEELSEEHP